MPFKSDAQRRFMYANHPRIAARWQKETGSKDLPEKIGLLQDDAGSMLSGLLDSAKRNKQIKTSALSFTTDTPFFEAPEKRESLRGKVVTAGLQELYKRAASDTLSEQHQQDSHEQQLQFSDEMHALELEKARLEIDQSERRFALEQQLKELEIAAKQQALEAKQQPSPEQQQQPSPEQQSFQQSMQYRDNIMKMSSVPYDQAGQPMLPGSPVLPVGLGALGGGVLAHKLFPSVAAGPFTEAARRINVQDIRDSLRATAEGKPYPSYRVSARHPITGSKVVFEGPAHARHQFYRNMALRANSNRILAGLLMGGLAGYGLHNYLNPEG